MHLVNTPNKLENIMVSLSSPNTHCYDGYPCRYTSEFPPPLCQQAFDQLWESMNDPSRRSAAQFMIDFAELNPCPGEVLKETKKVIDFENARIAVLTDVLNLEIKYDFEEAAFEESLREPL